VSNEPAPAAASVPEIPSTPEERNVAAICHIGGVLSLGVAPFLMWQMNKEKSAFVADQGKEATNFQLLIAGPVLVGVLLSVVTCFAGFIVLPFLVGSLMYGIMGSMAASEGKVFRYPVTAPLFK